MDSEKNTHMRELLEAGRPVTDEGPYYHHAWWESYKSSVKGKLGGGLIGAGIGAITGGLAIAGMAATSTVLAAGAPLLIVGGFAAAGLVYGVHEFSEVGKVTGAVAASQKTAEKRMKAYEDSKFDEIKEEIGELKAIVKGEKAPEKTAEAAAAALKEEQDNYRTDHFQGSNVEGVDKLFFWKVALVGLIVGIATGGLLAYGGMGAHILSGLGSAAAAMGATGLGHAATEAAAQGASSLANYVASITAFGAIGASFGINRDIFRQIFDQTDLWFRGFASHKHAEKVLLKEISAQPIAKSQEKKETVMYTPPIDYPESTTHHRDKLLAAAKEALLNMDHTKMSPH